MVILRGREIKVTVVGVRGRYVREDVGELAFDSPDSELEEVASLLVEFTSLGRDKKLPRVLRSCELDAPDGPQRGAALFWPEEILPLLVDRVISVHFAGDVIAQ